MAKTFTCPDCGHQWEAGKNGAHDCTVRLKAEVAKLRRALFPREELNGTYPVVLYFSCDAEREEFFQIVKKEMPNLKEEKL